MGTLKPNTVYRDTINLPTGNYRFLLSDTTGDGLEFWANPKGGRGKVRLLNKDGLMIKDIVSISSYPTQNKAETMLDYFANSSADVKVQIISDPGDLLVEEHHYPELKEGIFTYNLDRFPKSRYYIKVFVNGAEKFKKRIRLKEK